MKGYKHIPGQFADALCSGESIQIGLHSYYRATEGERGDPLEGVAEYQVDSLEPAHMMLPEYGDAREAVGLPRDLSHIQHLVFGQNTIRRIAAPAYLFCCSWTPDFSRVKEKGEAIVLIRDLRRFAFLVQAARPMSLNLPRVGAVTYERRSGNPFRQGLIDVDPFKKSMALRFENELRVAWPTGEDQPGLIQLAVPAVAGLMEVIARP